MARSGVNKALVQRARDALLARELQPSITAVRAELGHTGSKSTIQRYLLELSNEEHQPLQKPIGEELQAIISRLTERLAADAQETVRADRARLERQQQAYQQQRQVDQARQDEQEKNSQRLLAELEVLRAHDRQLSERLQHSEGERQRLLAAEQYHQMLLEERAAQLQSLEEKHAHAWEALQHYREQAQQQRKDEASRYEADVQQLRHDARTFQQQLVAKQEELGQVYRDLERLNAEQVLRVQELRHRHQEQEQQRRRCGQLESELVAARSEQAALTLRLTDTREKARHAILDRRQDLRNLRSLARQLAQLEKLLPAVIGAESTFAPH